MSKLWFLVIWNLLIWSGILELCCVLKARLSRQEGRIYSSSPSIIPSLSNLQSQRLLHTDCFLKEILQTNVKNARIEETEAGNWRVQWSRTDTQGSWENITITSFTKVEIVGISFEKHEVKYGWLNLKMSKEVIFNPFLLVIVLHWCLILIVDLKSIT